MLNSLKQEKQIMISANIWARNLAKNTNHDNKLSGNSVKQTINFLHFYDPIYSNVLLINVQPPHKPLLRIG